MAQNARKLTVVPESERPGPVSTSVPMQRAQLALKSLQVAMVLIFVIAGLDKYFHLLTNWEQYMTPYLMKILGAQGTHTFMQVEAAFEILIGIGVATRPRIFGYVAAVWLLGIIINLLTTGHFYDIALRDFGLCLSAFALGRLASGLSDQAPLTR